MLPPGVQGIKSFSLLQSKPPGLQITCQQGDGGSQVSSLLHENGLASDPLVLGRDAHFYPPKCDE